MAAGEQDEVGRLPSTHLDPNGRAGSARLDTVLPEAENRIGKTGEELEGVNLLGLAPFRIADWEEMEDGWSSFGLLPSRRAFGG